MRASAGFASSAKTVCSSRVVGAFIVKSEQHRTHVQRGCPILSQCSICCGQGALACGCEAKSAKSAKIMTTVERKAKRKSGESWKVAFSSDSLHGLLYIPLP